MAAEPLPQLQRADQGGRRAAAEGERPLLAAGGRADRGSRPVGPCPQLPEGERDHQGRPAGGVARGRSAQPAQLRSEVPGRDQGKTGAARLPDAGRADQGPGLRGRRRVRHQKAGRKFSRSTAHRKAMSRNLVTSLLDHGRIETTEAKGKELRRWVETVITTAKNDNVAARRAVDRVVEDPEVTERLFTKLMPRMKERPGGYTRLPKITPPLAALPPTRLRDLA